MLRNVDISGCSGSEMGPKRCKIGQNRPKTLHFTRLNDNENNDNIKIVTIILSKE